MRAFVAVEITEPAVLDGIRELQAALTPPDPKAVRLVDADTLHFTLQFLGEIPDGAQRPVADALSAVRFAPFDLEVGGVGAFPNIGSPRIVWVGGGGGGGREATAGGNAGLPLSGLARKVSGALAPLGYARDKPFRPHSTILRVKRAPADIAGRLEERAGRGTFGVQRVDKFKLKKSRLTPEGPVYTDLAVVEGAGR